jgi:AcrR family transcriptional regulator
MSRRKVTVELEPMLGAFAVVSVAGSPEDRILDAAAHLMRTYGLKRWSMEDVAERAAIGRTSVYRAFSTRDELVHAVLARELRATIGHINAAAAASSSVEDGIIEGALAGLAALRSSLVEQLLRTDPSTILPFLTTKAGPLIALTRQLLVAQARAAGASITAEHAEELAEIVARLGLSFVLTRETVFPIDDEEEFRASLRRMLRPVLSPLFATSDGLVTN